MVQVQSTWFPMIDINPQRFTDIYTARPEDFQKATQRVHSSTDTLETAITGHALNRSAAPCHRSHEDADQFPTLHGCCRSLPSLPCRSAHLTSPPHAAAGGDPHATFTVARQPPGAVRRPPAS